LLAVTVPAHAAGPAGGVALLKRIDAIAGALAEAATQEDAAARREAAAALVGSYADTHELARVCTKRLRDLSDQERAEVGDFLSLRLTDDLARWLTSADPARRPRRIEVRRDAPDLRGKRATVGIRVRIDGGAERRLELHLLRGRAGWKVWDLRGPGVFVSRSWGAHVRQLYARGGAIELMTRIQRHTQPPESGRPAH